MRFIIALIALAMLCSCTQEQVDRAEQASIAAKEVLASVEAAEARVKKAEEIAAAAVQAARDMAEQSGSDKAKAAVVQAEQALAVAHQAVSQVSDGVEVAHHAVIKTDQIFQTAKAAHDAGGSTLDVLIAIISTALPAAGGALVLIRKLMTTGQALKQTVSGISSARQALGEMAWKASVAPALDTAQDEAVKALVAKTIAAAKLAEVKAA